MNNEFIVLIAGFVTSIVVALVFATIVLLLKRRTIHNSGLNNMVYDTEQMKEMFTKTCTSDAIKMKGILEHPSTLENGEYRIFRPKKFITSFMPPTLLSLLGNTAPYLFGIETLYKASPKTTESIIEYINTVKQFVRSDTFTSLATLEKQYITIRIEEQLCKIIFKYIDGDSNKLNEGDKAIILDALDL